MNYISDIANRLEISKWGNKNPQSLEGVLYTIKESSKIFGFTPGYIQTLKSIQEILKKDKDSLIWFNYFSEIRCAYFLNKNNVDITGFNKKNTKEGFTNKKINLEIDNSKFCEIKSFEGKFGIDTDNSLDNDECVIENFSNNKLKPALEKQGADLLIIDNIFSTESHNYALLDYFLSFAEDDTDRGKMIRRKIGNYLPKLLRLSYVGSYIENPTVIYAGKEWRSIINQT